MRSMVARPRREPGEARPVSTARLKGLAAATGLGTLAAVAAPAALAHAGERGFILLLPTGLFQAGGTIAVAVSFLVVIWIRASALRRTFERASRALFPVPRGHFGWNVAASAVLVALVAAGLAGSRDPLANPLPLSVWTLMWVGLTFAHAVLGYLWPVVNPWTAFARLVRRLLGRTGGDDAGVLDWPGALGAWPAVALLVLFAWFELVHPAPQDPAILAFAVAGYSVCTVTGMVLFGNATWERNVEIFSRFFRIVSWIAPLGTIEEGGARRLAATFPRRAAAAGRLPARGGRGLRGGGLGHGLVRRALAHLLVARPRRREPAGAPGAHRARRAQHPSVSSAPRRRCSRPTR